MKSNVFNRKDLAVHIGDSIRRIVPDATIILYGSTARGDYRPDSDIDILVLLPEYRKPQFVSIKMAVMAVVYDIELETGIFISPLIVTQDMWQKRKTPFTVNVTNEGIAI